MTLSSNTRSWSAWLPSVARKLMRERTHPLQAGGPAQLPKQLHLYASSSDSDHQVLGTHASVTSKASIPSLRQRGMPEPGDTVDGK